MSIRFDSLNNSNFSPTTNNSSNEISSTKSNTINNNSDSNTTSNEVSSSTKTELPSQDAKQVFINDRNGFSDFRALQLIRTQFLINSEKK